MKILLHNTLHGLIPVDDDNYDEKKKLKIGKSYMAEIKEVRDIDKHRRYFALINCAWEYLPEERKPGVKYCQKMFGTKTNFRKSLQVTAGYYDMVYSIDRNEWIENPQSISFENMDDLKFTELYNGVLDVVYAILTDIVSQEEFINNLIQF